MPEKEYLIDDRCIIPEDIKQMTLEELQSELHKFEMEAAKKKKLSANSK